MRRLISILSFLFVLYGHPGAVGPVDRPAKGTQYETIGFRFAENLKFDNPFDLETNRVEVLILQPDSSRRVLSFFYDGLNKKGVEQWEARFTPKHAGLHRFTFRINGKVHDRFGIPVIANSGKKQGGLTLSEGLGIFRFESGEAFRGIGLNICWSDDYEYFFKKMRASGMNTTRIWLCPWHLPFEWSGTGLGRYDLESAQRLDTILRLAGEYGIYVLLCIDYHGVAQKEQGFFRENRWRENPYNRINGGPCADPAALFTDSTAQSFARKKYKYLIARYGHSPNIAAWEFFNEADLMAGKAIPVNQWHVEMADYVRSIDVHRRLISSSVTRRYVEKLVDAFRTPAVDFVMFHDYNMTEVAPHLINLAELGGEFYNKPVVIGEFGVEYRGAELTAAFDPGHIGLHNGIWAGFFSETPMLPMSWWWDSYIDKLDLWHHFAALSRFADSLDFNAKPLAFTRLTSGFQEQHPRSRASCTIQCITAGGRYALWFKSGNYYWSAKTTAVKLERVDSFTQNVPAVAPGTYSVSWYDPQTGTFTGPSKSMTVDGDRVMALSVPSFLKDLACLVVPVK
ncbi:MAG: cellulase family glycosylhydrolase [Chitinispirillaceae bacterium]|nr:cellulase family glycosylhydrolase [Chitinispirillaceae bacterium]